MQSCLEAEVSRDTAVRSGVEEFAGVVETYKRHTKAKKEAQRQAQTASTGPKDQDAPPGDHRVIPEDAPWQISTGTKAHARLLAGSSVGTQRYALEYFQRRGKGKGKGKSKGTTVTDSATSSEFGPTPAEARAYFQARTARQEASNPRTSGAGTPARAPSSASGALRPGTAAGAHNANSNDHGDDHIEAQLAGQRRRKMGRGGFGGAPRRT